MINQHPLVSVIFCVTLLIIVLMQSFTKRHFLKVKFLISIFFTLLAVLALVFNGEAVQSGADQWISWCLFVLDILVCIVMATCVEFNMSTEKFRQELTKSINETKYYVLLDKKDRVKEISNLFLKELDVELDKVIGKNFFDVLEMKYRIIGFNEQECYRKDIKKYYEHYDKRVVEGDVNPIALQLQEKKGKFEKALYFTETVIFSSERYKGRILFGDVKSESNLIGMEKDLVATNAELDILKSRFQSILQQCEDGIFFHTLNTQTIWFNDTLVHKLNLSDNMMSSSEFFRLIHPDDIAVYKERVKNLSGEEYDLSYRFNNGSYYVYVKEKGNIIRENDAIELCGVMNVFDDDSYQKTGTDLDNLGTETDLAMKAKELANNDRVFLAVDFYIDNIPEINEKFGRVVGNLMIANYIKVFKQNFIDDNKLYRVGGLEFVGIVTDYRKMDILKTNLQNKDKLYHLKADYMGKKIEAQVFLGLSYTNDTHNSKDVLKNAKECLKISQSNQYNANFAYYKDLH